MGSKSKSNSAPESLKARTVEGREDQLIALAANLAEQQLRDGTASSQVITHYLKLGSTKARLEKEILAEQKKLITAKTEALQSAARLEELYLDATKAFSSYRSSVAEANVDELNIQ